MIDDLLGPEVPTIVVGVDGSAGGWDALAWAAAEAVATGHALHVVHVVVMPTAAYMWPGIALDPGTTGRDAGAELVAEGARRALAIAPGLTITSDVTVGRDVADAVVRASSGATMLVVGKRPGRRPWWRRGHRRISLAVARRAMCPVAVVELTNRPGGLFAGWVVVLDDSAGESSAVMQFARTAARHRGTDVAVVSSPDAILACRRGAALVVVGTCRTRRRLRVGSPRVVARALTAATGPMVIVLA